MRVWGLGVAGGGGLGRGGLGFKTAVPQLRLQLGTAGKWSSWCQQDRARILRIQRMIHRYSAQLSPQSTLKTARKCSGDCKRVSQPGLLRLLSSAARRRPLLLTAGAMGHSTALHYTCPTLYIVHCTLRGSKDIRTSNHGNHEIVLGL